MLQPCEFLLSIGMPDDIITTGIVECIEKYSDYVSHHIYPTYSQNPEESVSPSHKIQSQITAIKEVLAEINEFMWNEYTDVNSYSKIKSLIEKVG